MRNAGFIKLPTKDPGDRLFKPSGIIVKSATTIGHGGPGRK
jgi:hypothetical protein